ncbi:MAG: hypothetical protein WAT19_08880 [Ferruginibacter sp.]
MAPDLIKLNRFTTIPFLFDLLRRKKLSLLNPAFWEDFNDRETIEIYRKAVKAKSIYALCMTYKNETIHHWNAFANGTSGCCIEFSPGRLTELLDRNGILHGKTAYIRVRDLATSKIEKERLPFVKREPFSPESEYRLIALSGKKQEASFDIDIDLDIIRKITISNKVPKTVFESLKASIKEMVPQCRAKIYHSTLYNNADWIGHFRNLGNGV